MLLGLKGAANQIAELQNLAVLECAFISRTLSSTDASVEALGLSQVPGQLPLAKQERKLETPSS